MHPKDIIKFKGNHDLVWWGIVAGCLFFVLAIYDQGYNNRILQGFVGYFFLLVFLWVGANFTCISIKKKNGRLLSKVFLGRGFKIDIQTITQIDRTSVFIFKTWGNRLQVHHIDENGNEAWDTIQESMYSVQTIKGLLQELKKINSSIELHPQYEALIKGETDEDYFKKMIPTKWSGEQE